MLFELDKRSALIRCGLKTLANEVAELSTNILWELKVKLADTFMCLPVVSSFERRLANDELVGQDP